MLAMACNFGAAAAPALQQTSTPGNAAGTAPSTPTQPSTTTLAPSATPNAIAANAKPIPGGPTLGDLTESKAAFTEGITTLQQAAAETYTAELAVGETRTFTIALRQTEKQLAWFEGWCAADENTLADNLKSMEFRWTVNDQPVDMSTIYEIRYQTSQNACFGKYNVIYGWPEGVTTLAAIMKINAPINDGFGTYPAGELTKIYQVTLATPDPNASLSAGEKGFSFEYAASLASAVTITQTEARLNSMTPNPAFTTYQFEAYPTTDSRTPALIGGARFQTFSASAFSRMSPITGEVVEILKARKPGEVPPQLTTGSRFDSTLTPFPPIVTGNHQMYYAAFQDIQFEGGSGYAYLTQYSFEPGIDPNWQISGLVYVFVGLAGEDTLIVGIFPVNVPGLPETVNNDSVGSLKPDQFVPDLTLLDKMFRSIQSRN
jgi:hypothetical protein